MITIQCKAPQLAADYVLPFLTSSHLPSTSGAQSTVTVACPLGKTIPKAGKTVKVPSCKRDWPPAAPAAPMSCLKVVEVIKRDSSYCHTSNILLLKLGRICYSFHSYAGFLFKVACNLHLIHSLYQREVSHVSIAGPVRFRQKLDSICSAGEDYNTSAMGTPLNASNNSEHSTPTACINHCNSVRPHIV